MKKTIALALALFSSLSFAADGFLSNEEVPNSYLTLAPFPEMNAASESVYVSNPRFAEDRIITESLFRNKEFMNGQQISYEREQQAVNDATTTEDYYIDIFVKPLKLKNEQQVISALKSTHLIEKVTADAKAATETGKDEFQRQRPYAYFGTKSCAGDTQATDPVKANHSYPSAHSTRGMTVAQTLADLLDDPTDPEHKVRKQILYRGIDYGDSRIICGNHWRSDIEAGRILAQAVYEKLEQNPDFEKTFSDVKKQISRSDVGLIRFFQKAINQLKLYFHL